MTEHQQPDLFAARAARDAGLAKVSRDPWMTRALAIIEGFPPGWTGTGEDLRLIISVSPAGRPHHTNAWGALTNAAVRRKLLTSTGRYVSMTIKSSHARKTPVYVRA